MSASYEMTVYVDDDDLIEFSVGHVDFTNSEGLSIIQKDYHIRGEVWRVHKNDADPFPSRPHAHCIEGRSFYRGGKMHLGTGELFQKSQATGFVYPKKNFLRLCEALHKKFPDLTFPLPT